MIPLVGLFNRIKTGSLEHTLMFCAVLGALLGTQNGREVDIVNTFELAVEVNDASVDHGFLVSRRDQCR
jgi:COP9 signalosome complex subunit 6